MAKRAAETEVVEVEVEEVELEVEPDAPAEGVPPVVASPKRAPGQKEIIPLAWKLVGTSSGTPVTLLKCLERNDAEAQMARLESEGYYKDLAIYAVSEQVPLSSAHQKNKKRTIEDAVLEVDAKRAGEPARGSKRSPAREAPADAAQSGKNKSKRDEPKARADRKGAARQNQKNQSPAKPTGKTLVSAKPDKKSTKAQAKPSKNKAGRRKK